MTDTMHAIIAIAIMAGVTAVTRFAPFVIFGNGKKTPVVVDYLGKMLPSAIMAMLVIYCLKDIQFSVVGEWIPALLGIVITAISYLWKKNTLLSIILGTALYMILIRVM